MATHAPIMGATTCAPIFLSARAELDQPGALDLHTIRAAHIARIDTAADRRRCRQPGSAMPHTLLAAGAYLAAHDVTDEPCEGERFFGTNFADYAALAADVPAIVGQGRRAIYEGRNPILSQLDAALDRMIVIQMTAYPSHWTDAEKRESAEHHLFGEAARG